MKTFPWRSLNKGLHTACIAAIVYLRVLYFITRSDIILCCIKVKLIGNYAQMHKHNFIYFFTDSLQCHIILSEISALKKKTHKNIHGKVNTYTHTSIHVYRRKERLCLQGFFLKKSRYLEIERKQALIINPLQKVVSSSY